jgi:hypothetical protein
MKQICTQIATFCLLLVTQNLFAQSATISTTDPNPTPAFGTGLTVSATNGFSTTSTGTFNEFPKNKTTTQTSPDYYYTSAQTVVYLKYNLSTAAVGTSTISAPTFSVVYGSTTITAVAAPLTVNNGAADYYIAINLGTTLPAGTNFRITVTFNVPSSDKTVRGNLFTTNALLVTGPIILPVKLVSFSGSVNKGKAELKWIIAENETAQKFEIQKSTNGTSFTTAAIISGTQKSGDEIYGFSENVSSDKVFYRLKMWDTDSKAEYSRTLAFNSNPGMERSLQVLTNPVREKLVISFSNDISEIAQLHIYDNSGRMVQKQNLNAVQGVNTTTVGLNSNYRSGLYIVELVTGNSKLTQKIIYSNQ